MNREQIIQMGLEIFDRMAPDHHCREPYWTATDDELEQFAALVAAAKEEEHKDAMRWDVHSCGPTCKRYACVATREAVAAEREACAKVVEEYETNNDITATWLNIVADAIRARSNT
jgi:hypothetical protein